MQDFISEDELKTFDGWLEYQGRDASQLAPADLEMWRGIFEENRKRADAMPTLGLMNLKAAPGEYRYAVAIRETSNDLWLALWVRRSPNGEYFVVIPRRDRAWNPHVSYHLDGTVHTKSFKSKVGQTRKEQPLTGVFRDTVHLGAQAGFGKSVGVICNRADFSGVLVVGPDVLGPDRGAITVDLVAPNSHPIEFGWRKIIERKTFKDVVPWVVLTVGLLEGSPWRG